MSTEAEKREAIGHAVEAARRKRDSLLRIKEVKRLTRAEEFELSMCEDCIQKGEKLLGVLRGSEK